MKIRRTIGSRAFDYANILIMLMLVLVTLYPFWYVIMASFSSPRMIMTQRGLLLAPLGFSLAAYKSVIGNSLVWTGYMNTLFVVGVGTALNLLMTLLGAYVMSRRNLALRKPFTLMIMFTMYFSGGLVPTYILVNNSLALGNSRWALILPGLVSTWNLLIMRTAIFGVPASIEESARLDGANDFTILFRIILPTIMANVAVIILYYAVGHWNAWFGASIYLRTKSKWPLQLVLREIIILSNVQDMVDANNPDIESLGETIKYAAIIISTLPILCAYPFLQKYFVKGVMIGAVKG